MPELSLDDINYYFDLAYNSERRRSPKIMHKKGDYIMNTIYENNIKWENQTGYVYKLLNTEDQKWYIGSGKGNPEFWVAVVKPGRILFEMGGEDITEETAKEAMRLAQYKLPVKTKFISIDKNLENSSQENTKNSKKSQEEVKQ